jgi:hypothetical protein
MVSVYKDVFPWLNSCYAASSSYVQRLVFSRLLPACRNLCLENHLRNSGRTIELPVKGKKRI